METINESYVLKVLNMYYNTDEMEEIMEDGIESGTEGWLDTLSEVIGKSAYNDSEWEEGDNERIMEFINVMEGMGINMF
jgi:hypothetical protein